MPSTTSNHPARGRRRALPSVAERARRRAQSIAATNQLPEVLTLRPNDAAKMLGIAESTVFKLLRNGEIEAVRPSPNMTLIPLASLHAFIARHRATPLPELSAAE